jgi:K+ transporter
VLGRVPDVNLMRATELREPLVTSAAFPTRRTSRSSHAGARFGYMDEPNLRAALRLLEQTQLEFALEVDEASYSCRRSTCVPAIHQE